MPTVGSLLDISAALLNDTQKQTYTYTVQLPYFQIALDELQQLFERSSISSTNETSAVIAVDAGVTAIGFSTIPVLPADLISISQMWERQRNINPFVPMGQRSFIPEYLTGELVSSFGIYAWEAQQIKLPMANRDNDIKLNYVKSLFTIVDGNSTIDIINADPALYFRTAALCARFIGENPTRAQELDVDAERALDRIEGIENKAKQGIYTRRKPFRASYKRRINW